MMRNQSILKPKIPCVLVIGGSGRLGGLLRRAWARAGEDLGLVWQARRQAAFAGQGGPDLVFDPLADPAALAAAAGAADAVLMLAGVTAGSEADLAANSALALAVLAASPVPVLLASSAAVYGAGPCREDAAPAPVAPYGRAKLAMEQAALASGRPVTVLRIGNVAGADALLGRSYPEGRLLDTFPDGHAPRRSFIGPQALAFALGRLLRLGAAGVAVPQVHNLALPGACGMDDLLRAAGEGWTARPAPAGVLPEVVLDTSRAVALGLVPEGPARAAAIVADLAGVRG